MLKNPSYIKHCFVFLLGFIVLDQGVRATGDWLIASPYWHDPLYGRLSDPKYAHDIAVFGSCRAVGYFRPIDMNPRLQRKILNGGQLAGGLGTLALSLSVYNSHHKGKDIVVVLDDWTLAAGEERETERLAENLVWWSRLNDENKRNLMNVFDINPLQFFSLESGLWRYRGRGKQLYVAAKRYSEGNEVPFFHPGPTSGKMQNPEAYLVEQTKSWEPSPFAINVVESLVAKSVSQGSKVLLMLPPFHRYRNSDEVNEKIFQQAQQIANRTGAQVLSYLDNHSELASKHDFWMDPGHMNALGSEVFLSQLSQDLEEKF